MKRGNIISKTDILKGSEILFYFALFYFLLQFMISKQGLFLCFGIGYFILFVFKMYKNE